MTATKAWPFGTDAIQDDPLTALRIPVVTSFKPMWNYTGAYLGTSADTGNTFDPPWPFASTERPTEHEVQQLLSFIAYHRHYWSTVHGYDMTRLDRRPLDVDCNSAVVFIKYGPDDWAYSRSSWTYGHTFVPSPPTSRGTDYAHPVTGPLRLDQVMDLIHHVGTKYPDEVWLQWKANHPEIFPAEEA